MSTSSWSFIAAGALILCGVAVIGIGYFLNRPSSSNQTQDEPEE